MKDGPAAGAGGAGTLTGVLLVFLDGVGIGLPDPERNPFFQARLPVLHRLLGDALPSLDRPEVTSRPEDPEGTRPARAFPVDACLGVEGLPQSGTGQASLFTGQNGPRRFGRHFGPWVPVALRPLVEEANLLRLAARRGHRVTFANAYPEGWPGERRARRMAGAPLAAHASGLMVRHADALARGDAVASEIVNEGWRRHPGLAGLPRVTPGESGAHLARIASGHHLTLFAHYATDTQGHRGGMEGAVRALERVDAFLGGVLAGLPEGHLLAVFSDHGNVEDVTAGHTRNPALGLLAGPGAPERSRAATDLTRVTPAILDWLEGAG